MAATAKQIIELIDGIAPFRLAERWDNCGLQAGSYQAEVGKVMVALDVTAEAMAAAAAQDVDLLLTHHPLFIEPPKQIDFDAMPGQVISMAARHGIQIVSAHTNLDKAEDGLNDYFSEYLKLTDLTPLVPEPDGEDGQSRVGIGRLGNLAGDPTVKQVAEQLKEALGIPNIRAIGNLDKKVSTAAVCTGSGGSLLNAFFATPAQIYITGDIKYHEAREIEIHDRALIDVGHFASEIIAVDFLTTRLKAAADQAGYDLDVIGFKNEMDPFVLV